ncbi:hypothetical protein GGS21DRAFT_490363 [Xylaria nigripes]|nr:hypothetical protein GGS21DRAFT_490363 [Xylaria nigripes]
MAKPYHQIAVHPLCTLSDILDSEHRIYAMTIIEKSTRDVSYHTPKTRQRFHKEPPALAVTDIHEDAPDMVSPHSTSPWEAPGPQSKPSLQSYLSSSPIPDITLIGLELGSGVNSQTTWPVESLDAAVNSLLPVLKVPHGRNIHDVGISSQTNEPSMIENEAAGLDLFENSKTTDTSFPDSYYIPVNKLKLLRGLVRITMRLRCNFAIIWELTANSPFNDGTHSIQTTQELPSVLRPTSGQTSIPHHPVIDLLPWPNVCGRIISLLSLPDEARPEAAAGPLAIAQLAYDLEDAAEGIRI